MPDLTWLKSVNPTLAFAVSLIVQAAVSAWFLRGLKADRDRIAEDVAQAKKDIVANAALAQAALASYAAAAKLSFDEIRSDHADLEQAVGITGSQMFDLRAGYAKMEELVLETMPKVIQGAVERAELRGENRARRAR